MFTYLRAVKKFRLALVSVIVLCSLLVPALAGDPDPARALEDLVPPEIHGFTINHGDMSTGLHEVTVQLEAADNLTPQDLLTARYANEDLVWTPWEAYRDEREWLLSGGDGEKTVHVQVRDEAGNVAEAAAYIDVFVPVTGIELDWSSLVLVAGDDPVQLSAAVSPEHATDRRVTWHSSAPAVAGVSDGVVTPLSEGVADITATTADGGFAAGCRVEVLPAAPAYDSTIKYGDVTGTGVVDVGDAIVILRYIVGEVTLDEGQKLAADVNLDGVVDVGDAIIVLRYIVGLVPGLPVGYAPPVGDDPPPGEDPPDEDPPGEDPPVEDPPVLVAPTNRLLNTRFQIHPTAQVNCSELNVRSGPGTGYLSIGAVYRNQRFIIREQAHTGDSQYPLWYRINYYGQQGWIAANFVIAMDVLYGLDYWSNLTRLADAPANLGPGEYRIDREYQFLVSSGSAFNPTGKTFYFLEQIPYATMLLERPADPQLTASFLAQAARQLRSDSPFPGLADTFIQAQETWGANALFLMALSALESAWGTSAIARDKNNIFGFMAYDHDPYESAAAFRCMEDCILQVSAYIRRAYLSEGGTWFNGPHLVGMNEKYASDPMWAFKIAAIMQSLFNHSNYTPVEKQLNRGVVTAVSLNVRSGPGSGFDVLETLPQGSQVKVAGMKLTGDTAWLKVVSGPVTGWSSGQYIDLVTRPRGVVYFGTWYKPGNENLTLNVRSEPDLASTVLESLTFGASFSIERLETVYDSGEKKWYVWYLVDDTGGAGSGGWVRCDYVVVDW